jgi:hypothetical protein
MGISYPVFEQIKSVETKLNQTINIGFFSFDKKLSIIITISSLK